ncbi:MAG TPA: YciI family protein [Mucilaginibacter sp.]|jgi:hypothetical protein
MKDYVFIFRGGLNFATAAPEELQQALMKWKTWIDELTKDGRYNGGERLLRNGTVVKGNQKQVVDGPYLDGEIAGGYTSIKAADLQEAIEISKGCPIFNYDGIVEIREVAKM